MAGVVVLGGAGAAIAAQWRSVSVPLPAGASGASLNAVACARMSLCWAVGTAKIRHRGHRALAERWNGQRWRVAPVPSPARLGGTGLLGVACSGPSACMAVGTTGAGQGGTLAERWNGRAWSLVATPSPSGSSLSAISCATASDCLAVGNSGAFQDGIFNYSLNLAWNGTVWTREPYHETGWLNGVSCPSAIFCAAVGDIADSAGTSTVTEQWNGATISDVPSGDGNSSELQGVSCVSTTFCMAVGTGAFESNIVSLWNGKRWRFAGSPGGLDAVWCLRSNLCVAAGGGERVARWNGRRWVIQPGPGAGYTGLNGVTCTGPSACLAVGSDRSQMLALRYG